MSDQLPVIQRFCSDCRHARWHSYGNGRDEPRETEQDCDGLPAHPQAGCDECIRLQNLAEMEN